MSRISQTVKNLISGISQQPALLRLPEQLSKQVNGFSTESSGLQKRPPTLYVNKLGDLPSNANSLVHLINRDEEERYIMMFDGTDVQVWDNYGNAKTVKYEGNAKSYITCSNPRKTLRLITIADYTFIVNRDKIVTMGTAKVEPKWDDHSCLINVKSGQYGRTYKILINNSVQASYETPNGSDADDSKKIDTNYIRDQLATQLTNNGWTVTKANSAIYMTKSSVTIKTVKCVDGFNNNGMYGIFHTAQKFTNLPAEGIQGYTVRVLGDSGSNADDYYVTYNEEDAIWKECAKPDILASYDADTMPHVITRNSDGTFTVKTAEWDDRDTGDDDSNPAPSFVDATINDIFLFRNRLGLLSGENIILSRSASFFNFWIASAIEVQDTDPIDLAVSDNKVCTLYHAVPFNEDLLLFSAETQFLISVEGTLSPQNITAPLCTQFTSDSYVSPVGLGRRVYYTTKRAQYSTVREFYTMNDTNGTKDSQDITSHVPSLIPNGVFSFLPCNNENVLMLATTAEPDKLYVYKYLFTEEARMQSSWSYWQFKGAHIYGGGFFDSTLYLVMGRGSHLYLEKCVFTYNTKDFDVEPYRVFLDRKSYSTIIDEDNYDSINDKTSFNLKDAYFGDLSEDASYGIVTEDGHYYDFTYDEANSGKVWVNGDLRNTRVTFGEAFEFLIELSPFMIKQRGDAGVVAEEEGRLQLTRMTLNFDDSGYFEVKVKYNDPRDPHTYYHTARILGAGNTKMGEMPTETGSITFPIMGLNTNCTITVSSSTPTAMALLGYHWEGNYIKRTRSI